MCVPGEKPSRPAAEQCRSHMPLFVHSSIKRVTSLVCGPIPDPSPYFSLSSLPSSALALMALARGACAWPICSVPYASCKDCQVRAWCSVTRLQPGVAGLSFLSPTWSLGNSLIVLQGQPWMRSWSSFGDGAAGHPDEHLMGIHTGLLQGLSVGHLGLTWGH